MNDFTIILRSMHARLFSTVTTVITAAVSVALMLVILMMKDAGQKAFERGSGDMHLVATAGGSSPMVAVLNCIFYANPPRSPLSWSKYEELRSRAPWSYAIPTQQGDSYLGQPVMATTTDFFIAFKPNPGETWTLREGKFFTGAFEIVVGSDAASLTGLKVGDEVFLTHGIRQSKELGAAGAADSMHVHYEFAYKVVGILAPTGGSHDRALFTDLDSTWIIHAHDRRVREDPKATKTTLADLLPEDRKITGVYLRLITREGSDTPANLPQVFDMLRRDAGFTIAQPQQEISSLFRIVSSIDRLFLAIAGVVMVSSAIAIMLALYNSMEQRRRQIAILRVLGATKLRVFGLIVAESIIIGALGAAVGVAVSIVGGSIASGILRDAVGLVIEPGLPPRQVVAVCLATVLLAAGAGMIPAWLAYATSVARNLRPQV